MTKSFLNDTETIIRQKAPELLKNPYVKAAIIISACVGGIYILSLIAKSIGHSIENFKELTNAFKV